MHNRLQFGISNMPKLKVHTINKSENTSIDLLDISISGFSLVSEELNLDLTADTIIHVNLKELKLGDYNCTARIVRQYEKNGQQIYAAKFTNIPQELKEKIDQITSKYLICRVFNNDNNDLESIKKTQTYTQQAGNLAKIFKLMVNEFMWSYRSKNRKEFYHHKPLCSLNDYISKSVDCYQIL